MVPAQNAIESRQPSEDLSILITRIAQRDHLAMSHLYDASSRLLFGLLLRIVNDHGVAEEVLLDVYMQVWRQAGSYDERRGSPLAWMLTIARSRAIDRLRSGNLERQRREPFDLSLQYAQLEPSAEEAVTISELRNAVRAALDLLPVEQREVIELAYYGGLSQREIALKINKPLGTIKTRARLGMTKLREALKTESAELL